MQHFREHLRQLPLQDIFGWAIIILGLVLRLRQYLTNRSLWADEASLAYNLANRDFISLTKPLDYQQGAPVGFLFIEKFLVVVFGNVDQVMRLFPLFAGIMSVYLLHRITRERIRGGLLAVLLLSIGWTFVYYSTELKQYSSDVFVSLLLIFLATRCFKENPQRGDFLILGAVGMLAIWVSHPSAFLLGGIGLALFLAAITRKSKIPTSWLFILGAVWVISFGAEYLVSLRHLVADEFMQTYWKKAFMPLPPWRNLGWLINTYHSIFLTTFYRIDRTLLILISSLTLIGTVSLLFHDRSLAITITFPFLFALLASALKLYPLRDRFMLFLIPLWLMLVAEGLEQIHAVISRWSPASARAAYLLLAVFILFYPASSAYDRFISPYNWVDLKPVMKYVREHRASGETIYVYHSSDPAFNYYAPLYGIDRQNVLVGFDTPRKKIALQGFFSDVETLQGTDRVWFIFSDIVDCGDCEGDLQQFYVDYLDERGIMLDSVHAAGANGYLYDLKP